MKSERVKESSLRSECATPRVSVAEAHANPSLTEQQIGVSSRVIAASAYSRCRRIVAARCAYCAFNSQRLQKFALTEPPFARPLFVAVCSSSGRLSCAAACSRRRRRLNCTGKFRERAKVCLCRRTRVSTVAY